jgi:hypothetical protein
MVEKFKKCDTAYEQAEKGVKEMRKAKAKMEEIYNATVEAQQKMFEVSDILFTPRQAIPIRKCTHNNALFVKFKIS